MWQILFRRPYYISADLDETLVPGGPKRWTHAFRDAAGAALMAIRLSVLGNSREGREETHLAQERNTMKSDPVHTLKSCV